MGDLRTVLIRRYFNCAWNTGVRESVEQDRKFAVCFRYPDLNQCRGIHVRDIEYWDRFRCRNNIISKSMRIAFDSCIFGLFGFNRYKKMNKGPVLFIVILLIAGAVYYLQSTKISIAPSEGPISPELTGITGYINTEEGTKISDFRGKVVLVDFWTYTCINCIRTLPFLVEWDKRYRDAGLVIIGVHTPEFEFEKEIGNVKYAVKKHGIKYPVVNDPERKNWDNYGNQY